MKCLKARRLFGDYLDRRLDSELRQALKHHLAACAECRAELAALRRATELLHGATAPDPEADRGKHELLYSLLPHRGDWKAAETTRRGMEINSPLIARVPLVHGGTLPKVHSFVRVGPGNVILSALKKEMGYAERGLVLRLYEIHGVKTEAKLEFPWPVIAEETDLIERPSGKSLGSGTAISVPLGPFEIKTIRVTLK